MRRKLGLDSKGGTLHASFDETSGQVVLSKPLSIEELSTRLSSYIKPGTPPVTNVDEYYQAHRKPRI